MTLEDNWKKIGVEHVARPNVRWSRIVIILYLACYAVLVLDFTANLLTPTKVVENPGTNKMTSFFAPKPSSSAKAIAKLGGSKKHPRDGAAEQDEPPPRGKASGSRSNNGKSSGGQLPDETTALLAHLHPETDGNDSGCSSSPPLAVSWRGSLEKHFAAASFASLARFVASERRSKTVYPPARHTFSALNLTPLRSVRVVIVGKDRLVVRLVLQRPPGGEVAPEPEERVQGACRQAGARQPGKAGGAGRPALLNSVLTVRRGEAASHSKKRVGREEFTDNKVIAAVLDRDAHDDGGRGVVFLLWGKPASKKATAVLGGNGREGK